ncbi:MAG TPA: Uma2 family endonuclease [Planctomycetaceae bacterium]|nr:Uma2 family endonuclease [Planctomycetaceae bacterium]
MTALLDSAPMKSPPKAWSLSALAERFGPMPGWRIVTDRAPGEATEADVDELQIRTKWLAELVDGVLVRKAMGSYESVIAVIIATHLQNFVQPRKLGWVLGESGMLRLWPGRVRIPDACFIARTQTPDGKFPRHERIASLFPDLAVEVLSDSNTREEMDEKLRDYFQSGTRLVWYVDPLTKTATVYTAVDQPTSVPADGVLSGDPVLPGLAIRLADVFDVE